MLDNFFQDSPFDVWMYREGQINWNKIHFPIADLLWDNLGVILDQYQYNNYTPFSDQFWTICTEFGKSATNFDIAAAESCPTGRRTAEPPKLPALFPKCMHCRLNWPEKGVFHVTVY